MLLKNNELIAELRERVQKQIAFCSNELGKLPVDSLNFKPSKGEWSALECIEHLNMVFDLYLPRMQGKLSSPSLKEGSEYQTGFMGDRMVSSMEPVKEKIRHPMKTFKSMKPERSKRKKDEVISQFIGYMNELDTMLEKSENIDLGRIRIKSAIGNILRFKLGDCYRFYWPITSDILFKVGKCSKSCPHINKKAPGKILPDAIAYT